LFIHENIGEQLDKGLIVLQSGVFAGIGISNNGFIPSFLLKYA